MNTTDAEPTASRSGGAAVAEQPASAAGRARRLHNRVIHFEIPAVNTTAMAEFYRSAFGWEIKRWANPAADYWEIMTAPEASEEPGIDGGISARTGPMPGGDGALGAFTCTIRVPNLDEYIGRVEKAGGKLAVPRMAIPGMAWLAYCTDIEGNRFGLFEEDKNAK